MSTNKNLCDEEIDELACEFCMADKLTKQLRQAGLDYERGDISIVEYYGIKQAITRELVMLEAD